MPPPQASAKALNAGVGAGNSGKLPLLCKAFKGAVKNWCRDRGPPDVRKGNFNDYFYRSLSSIRPDGAALAGNLTREVGGVFSRNSGRLLGLVTNPNLGGVARQAAGCAVGIFGNMLGGFPSGTARALAPGASAAQGAAARNIANRFGDRVYTRWADGVFRSDGRVLEIKGPTDGPRPGQLRDAKKMGKGKAPEVVSCAKCKAGCSKSNPCP